MVSSIIMESSAIQTQVYILVHLNEPAVTVTAPVQAGSVETAALL